MSFIDRLKEWRMKIGFSAIAVAAVGVFLTYYMGVESTWVAASTGVAIVTALLCFLGSWIILLFP